MEAGDYRTVLVIEDEPTSAYLTSNFFSRAGCKVTSTEDPLDALGYFVSNTFDLTIVDIILPNIDGKAILERLLDMNASRYIVAISASKTIVNNLASSFSGESSVKVYRKPLNVEKLKEISAWSQCGNPDSFLNNGDIEVFEDLTEILSKNPIYTNHPDSIDMQEAAKEANLNTMLFVKIYEIAGAELPAHQANLESMLAAKNFEQMSHIAHKVAGISAYTNFVKLGDFAKTLQATIANTSRGKSDGFVFVACTNFINEIDVVREFVKVIVYEWGESLISDKM